MVRIPILIVLAFAVGCSLSNAQEISATEKLRKHSEEFRREVIKVAGNIYVAVGFGASNSSMIITDSGLVIVDTTEAESTAAAVLKEFRKITDKPVLAIIYTHSHRDHIGGASIFAANGHPDIYARSNFVNELVGGSPAGPILKRRAQRQFGIGLKADEERINIGIGKRSDEVKHLGLGFIAPTTLFGDDRLAITIGGVTIEMVAAPGETDDQMYVWLPREKALFAGDNFYKAFPNLYPIRGSRYRDVKRWADSLKKMHREQAAYLIPSHSRPVIGLARVDKALSDYSEAVNYLHDATLEGMNKGLTADQLAVSIMLPETLKSSPYLQEFYGAVPWAVRSIFSGYLGWFDGNPTTLQSLSQTVEAARIARLAGGKVKMFDALQLALTEHEYQWALQLSDYLLLLSYKQAAVTQARIIALRGLAETQINATSRNYYLSCAKELEKGLRASACYIPKPS